MKKLYILILLIPLIFSCRRSNDLTEQEIYSILNEIIADDSLRLYVICAKPSYIPVDPEYGFTEKEKNFIQRQQKIYEKFSFADQQIKYYSEKKDSFVYSEIDRKCDEGIINKISFPLISPDRKKVVLQNSEDCHCMLGGGSKTTLYVKVNGHWKVEKVFDWWISENRGLKIKKKVANSQWPTCLAFRYIQRLKNINRLGVL